MADPAERDPHDIAVPILSEAAERLEKRGLSLQQIADELLTAAISIGSAVSTSEVTCGVLRGLANRIEARGQAPARLN